MNKATSVQSFTYLGLVVSEKNVPKNWHLTLWGYDLQSPLKRFILKLRKSYITINPFEKYLTIYKRSILDGKTIQALVKIMWLKFLRPVAVTGK